MVAANLVLEPHHPTSTRTLTAVHPQRHRACRFTRTIPRNKALALLLLLVLQLPPPCPFHLVVLLVPAVAAAMVVLVVTATAVPAGAGPRLPPPGATRLRPCLPRRQTPQLAPPLPVAE